MDVNGRRLCWDMRAKKLHSYELLHALQHCDYVPIENCFHSCEGVKISSAATEDIKQRETQTLLS